MGSIANQHGKSVIRGKGKEGERKALEKGKRGHFNYGE